MYELVKPWANTNSVVVADSYFASVQAALCLKKIGLRFIDTIKTATKEFPMAYLGSYQLHGGKGDRHGVVCKDMESGTDFLAFVWVDRDRQYFISTCSSLTAGPPCIRWRWKQVDRETPNAPPEYKEVFVQQPEACYIYYGGCGKIDQHNRYQQASLALERKLHTNNWHRRVNMSIFGIICVDSFLLQQGCQGNVYKTGAAYFARLAKELIENTYKMRALRKKKDRASFNDVGGKCSPDTEVCCLPLSS
jgi:hypothetical protein